MRPIAIVGFAGRFPGAADIDAFWANLIEGRESISRFTAQELERSGVPEDEYKSDDYVPARGVVEDADCFDAEFFGYSVREALLTDPQQRLLLECAWHAMEHAGFAPGDRSTGVFVGTGENTHPALLEAGGELTAEDASWLALSNAPEHAATRIAYKLGLTGPALAVATACSTALVAVHLAASSLQLGECDLALAGAASLQFPQAAGYRYSPYGTVSPDGHCRPFAADAGGAVPGGGAAVVVLRRLEDALADGDTVHAVIRGSAVNNDGSRKAGYAAPSPHGQREVVSRALTVAETDPATIGYVEANGTGTPMGDRIEVQALTEAFRRHTDARGYCLLGSVKSNIGHLNAAAGVAGLIKAALAVREGVIPRTLHLDAGQEAIAWDETPFAPALRTSAWTGTTLRRAAVSAFGMGGTNAHVVLEQAPAGTEHGTRQGTGHEARRRADPGSVPALITLSGADQAALAAQCEALAEQLARGGADLADVAHTLRIGRAPLAWRVAVAGSAADLPSKLRNAAARKSGRVTLGLLLPGDQDPYPGMAADPHEHFAGFREWFDTCINGLSPQLGREVRELLLRRGPDERAGAAGASPLVAQAALFTFEYAVCGQLEAWGLRPRILLGHGVGELVAACVGGALELSEALRILETPDGGAVDGPGRAPRIPVISGSTGQAVSEFAPGYRLRPARSSDPTAEAVAAALAVRRPVLIDVGPGGTLSRLAQDADPRAADRVLRAVPADDAVDVDAADDVATSLLQAAGAAWSSGAEVDWAAFGPGRRVPLPLYPFARRRVLQPNSPGAPADATSLVATFPDATPRGTAFEDDDVTELLRAAWQRLLAVTVDEPDADFFALGGDSLLAGRLLATVRRRLGITVKLDQMLSRRTFAEQVELLRTLRADSSGPAPGSESPETPTVEK